MELTDAPLYAENCEHFSIRGFAAKVHKKDRSICWPFPGQERDEVLQPILVPKFRYWKCTNCVKKAEKENLGENVEVPNHKCGLLRSQPSPKVKATKGRLGTSSSPVCVIDVDNDTSLDTNASVHIHPSEDGHTKPVSHHTEENVDDARKEIDLSAVKSKIEPKRLKVNAEKNVNQAIKSFIRIYKDLHKHDDVRNIRYDSPSVSADTCPSKGHDVTTKYGEEEFTSPKAIVGEDREKLIKECKFKKSRRKQLSPNINNPRGMEKYAGTSLSDTGAHEGTDYYSSMNEVVNAVTLPKCSESSHQTLENGHLMSHSPVTTGKRKQIKVRTLGNIISRCGEKEAGTSSSGSDASFGLDLNLSPTHQVVKTKKRKDMEEEEKEYMEISSQKPLPVTIESSAKEEQQATIGNDQTVSSCSKKDQNVEIENEDSSSLIFQDGATPSVQKENEHTQLHPNGTPLVYAKSAKDASSERAPPFDAKTSMAGVEVIQKNKEILEGKFPLLLPENLTKRPNILKKPSGQIGNRSSQQQSSRAFEEKGNATSEQASVDDIPMDVVELMAKHQHERRLSAGQNRMCLSETNTNKVRDSTKTNRKESLGHENLKFLRRSKFLKNKLQCSNEGSTSTGANKPRLANLAPSNADAPQNGRRTRGFCFDPEQSRTYKGFTAIPEYQDKSYRDTQFPVTISSRNFGNQSVTCSKNKEAATSRAHTFLECLSRDVGHENSTFILSKEKPSGGDQFLVGASCSIRGGSYQNNSFLRSQEKTITGAQFLVGSSKISDNQSSIYSQFQEAHPIRTQSLSNNPADLLAGHTILERHPQSCSQSSEAYRASQHHSWQSSDQCARSSMRPDCLPQNSKPLKFAGESSTPQKKPHCLQLFPESSMNGNPSPKSTDLSGNHCDKKNWGLDLGTTMGTHLNPHVGDSGNGIPSNLKPARPVDLCNKESIPATHLLRLMDAGLCSSSQKLSQQFNMFHDHRQLEMSRFEHSKNNERSFFPSTADHLFKNHHPGSSSEKLASVPEGNTASVFAPVLVANIGCSAVPVPQVNGVCSPLQNRGNSKMDSGLKSFRDQRIGREKVKEVSGNCRSAKNNESAPILHLQKGGLGTAVTMQSPSDSLALKDSTNRITCKRKQPETVCPPTDFCFSNRNPAEFTIPGAGNSYMTGYENVKLKENILSRDRTEMVESVHNKKPKKVRFADM